MQFSDLRYIDSLQRHLRSKSKVVRNLAEFWTFFALQILLGDPFQTLYTQVITAAYWHVFW